jgi:hypothetical protein
MHIHQLLSLHPGDECHQSRELVAMQIPHIGPIQPHHQLALFDEVHTSVLLVFRYQYLTLLSLYSSREVHQMQEVQLIHTLPLKHVVYLLLLIGDIVRIVEVLQQIQDHHTVDGQEKRIPSDGNPQGLLTVVLEDNRKSYTRQSIQAQVHEVTLEVG